MNTNSILQFLDELSRNNNREWFAQNKTTYDKERAKFEQLSTELITEIAKFDDEIKHVEVKDCIFRIYRDTRFSNDKTPYKTHFGIFIASSGGRKSQRGGYYLHLDPKASFIASGVWCPQPNLLNALRKSVYDNIDELNTIRENPDFFNHFTSFFDEDKLKTIPRGFPKDFPHAELLKLKHYIVEHKLEAPVLGDENFVQHIAGIFKFAQPFNQFFNYTVDEVL